MTYMIEHRAAPRTWLPLTPVPFTRKRDAQAHIERDTRSCAYLGFTRTYRITPVTSSRRARTSRHAHMRRA